MDAQHIGKEQGKVYVTEYMYKFMPPQSQLQTFYRINKRWLYHKLIQKKWKEGMCSHVVKDYFIP